MPVSSSTTGYIHEIGVLHARHLPPSSSQLTTGMLSHGLIAAPHFGQAEAGSTTDFRSGIRTMHTFRKLPITRPNRAANTPISAGEATCEFCHTNAAKRPSPRAVVPQPLTRRRFYVAHPVSLGSGCSAPVLRLPPEPSPARRTALGAHSLK